MHAWGPRLCLAVPQVSAVLAKIAGTEFGNTMTNDEKGAVDRMLEGLEATQAGVLPRPIDDPAIFGNYRVSYVSPGAADQQSGSNPAGGRSVPQAGRSFGTEIFFF